MSAITQNSVVVITGGGSGIGKQLAIQFAKRQARVIIIDKDQTRGNAVVGELNGAGYDIQFEVADMANITDAQSVFKKIVHQHDTIDHVINNAGIFMGGEIRDTPIEDYHVVVKNNIFAIMNGTHFAYDAMLRQGSGHITNVGSAAGLTPIPAMGIYGSTKYAINGFTLALRNEAKSIGIHVSLVCPTIVDTPLYDTAIYHRVHKRKALARRSSFQASEVAALRIIKGIEANKSTIHTATSTRLISLLYRLSPALYNIFARKVLRAYRERLRTK